MATKSFKQRKRTRKLQKGRGKPKGTRSTGMRGNRLPRLKMSDVIRHIAEPLVEQYADSPKDMEQIISLTVAAWNVALLPPERRERERLWLARKLFRRRWWGLIPLGPDSESLDMFRYICDVVAERKEQLYPEVNHFIVDVQFEPRETGVYFEVMYALDMP